MSRFVRPSKYRHVYGSPAKKEGCYDNVKVSNNAWDTNLVAGNGKYVSVNWQASGGGAFAIIPANRTGKLPDIYPLCRAHTAAVLDTAFSPFDDSFVASASDDGTVGLWKVDESVFEVLDLDEKQRAGRGIKDMEPVSRLQGGGRKIGQVVFHPTASNVLAAASGDHVIKLWDVEAQQPRIELTGFGDSIQSLDFNYTGSVLAATCRDRKFRLFDTRKSGGAVQTTDSHGGIKGARVAWCGSLDRIVTTGFSKMSDRQVFLWDSGAVSKPLKQVTLDTSSGVMMPFWSDNNILFLAGKGDGNIRYYELENDELHYLTEYKSVEPQRGMGFAPRRALNADENEIARAYKVTGSMIEPISFIVPRRAESFQADIFPPAPSAVPALTAAEFFAGKTATPNLVNLEDGSGVSGKPAQAAQLAPITPAEPAPAPAPASAPAPVSPVKSFSRQTSATEVPKAAPAPAAVPVPTPAATTQTIHEPERTSKTQSTFVQPAHDGPARNESKSTYAALRENGNAAGGAAESGLNGSTADLRAEIDALKAQLAERDSKIRVLEVENEKLKANATKVKQLLS